MTAAEISTRYCRAVEFLYGLRWFGAKFGLENTLKLAGLAGDPQRRLRFIHVAGTNGKGSTCAMLESIYRASGLKVGLFTSPHLVSFRERIQVDRRLIREPDVARLVDAIRPLLKEFPEDHHPTFFETVTVMALQYFSEQKCDLVVWETGLGGRLDATNIVTPLASVITNIQHDHQQWLGSTLAAIAGEKAGIIKPGVPVLTSAEEPEALAIIEQIARELKAPLTRVEQASRLFRAGETPALRLKGEHQRLNATLALAVVETLQRQLPVSDAAINTGLSTVNWPGRLQLVTRASGQKLLLDGAHNVAGARALAATLKSEFPAAQCTLILGILLDKDRSGMCELLAPLARNIFLVPVPSERSATPQELAELCRLANPAAQVVVCSSLDEAKRRAESDSFVVVAGSLYLVGEAMELFGLLPAADRDERGLNEWSAGRTGAHKS